MIYYELNKNIIDIFDFAKVTYFKYGNTILQLIYLNYK